MPYLKNDKYLRTIRQTTSRIKAMIYTQVGPLSTVCYKSAEPLPYAQRTQGVYTEMQLGDIWGDRFDCGWFHFTGIVPPSCKDAKVALVIDVDGEGLIVDESGNPKRGLTCVSSEFDRRYGLPGKRIYSLLEQARGGEAIDLWMDAGCNDLFGSFRGESTLREAHIAVVNDQARDLYYDLEVLLDLLDRVLDDKSAQYKQTLMKLYHGVLAVRSDSSAELAQLAKAVKELYHQGGESFLHFTAIGHSHIDLAWLWPIRETKRKGARTFATVLELMERYPEYKFGASQPQLFQWMKEEYPPLYARIKQRVQEGRWELQGCMWVEADTNLSGGEALVRQILYGKRFFQEEFGVEVKNLWLPDVFGYNAALPQLLRKSGCDYFMTQKLSWSEHNKFPHHTFLWEGIDGTSVFTHMLPENVYNAPMLPWSIKFAEENYADAGVCEEALILFGIGDGGGGPGPEHLERARRVRNLQGLCPVENSFAQPMLERLEQNTRGKLQTWCGELYLERHQGTYTTQARNKYWNRRLELALRELELALVLSGSPCPKAELDAIWQEVLLYQFHDIIPGSSIKRVYDESVQRYELLYSRVCQMTQDCYQKLAANKPTAFNALSWERQELVTLSGKDYLARVPGLGCSTLLEEVATPSVSATSHQLENDALCATFDESGALVSLFDKVNGREALAAPSGQFALWQDVNGDCWDIAIEYTDRAPDYFALESMQTLVQGARACCVQRYLYGKSTLTATYSLEHGGNRLNLTLEVDWQENQKMLRTGIAANVHTDHASFEIQYGKLNRPNNDNTMWQKAQFEVCGHRWVDLSQPDYGVALLNDCKYGYRTIGNVIDVNLLRSQNYPGEQADRGLHTIRLAIYPHKGDEAAGQVCRAAHSFNSPLAVVTGGMGSGSAAFAQLAGEVIIEAVKPAEDGNGIIMRLYEPYGRTVTAALTFDHSYRHIAETDLLENTVEALPAGNGLQRVVKPFEIVTLRLVP